MGPSDHSAMDTQSGAAGGKGGCRDQQYGCPQDAGHPAGQRPIQPMLPFGKVAKVQVRRDHRAPDQAEGQFPYKAGTQPSRAAPPTAQGMYRSGKMFRITSSKIQPINSASRYHMGPQEKNSCPK